MNTRVYNKLDGLISVFKPTQFKIDMLLANLQRKLFEGNICDELFIDFSKIQNDSFQRTAVKFNSSKSQYEVVTQRDFALSPLGFSDFPLVPINPLDDFESGVQGHVTRHKIDKVLKRFESTFSSSAILHAGLRPNTKAAFLKLCERWSKDGDKLKISDLRPKAQVMDFDQSSDYIQSPWELQSPTTNSYVSKMKSKNQVPFYKRLQAIQEETADTNIQFQRENTPYVHNLRCISFNPPEFTIEMQSCHETFDFFINFIANLAPFLKSATHTAKIRRIRHGPIGLNHTLVYNQCHLMPNSMKDDTAIQLEYYRTFLNIVKERMALNEFEDESPNQIVTDSQSFMLKNDSILSNVLLCTNLYKENISQTEHSNEKFEYTV